MKNIEKYEEELKEYGTQFAITKEGVLVSCDEVDCLACLYKDSNCIIKKMEWLSQEYKEPILTDKEKAYLKNVIEPKKDDITWIRKWCFYKGTESEYTTVTVYAKHPAFTSPNSLWVLLDSIVTEEMPFKGMELEKAYSLEELGLWLNENLFQNKIGN